jgi:hypothetical protein
MIVTRRITSIPIQRFLGKSFETEFRIAGSIGTAS